MKRGAKILMKQAGGVIAASQQFGSGAVLWLGSNWTYHITRGYSMDEARLWAEWLKQVGIEPSKGEKMDYQAERVNEGRWKVVGKGAKGVLIKEVNAGGWIAKSKIKNQKSKIMEVYSAGPAVPGFVYVPLAQLTTDNKQLTTDNQIELVVEWKGRWQDKVSLGLAGGILVSGILYVIFPGLVGRGLGFLRNRLGRLMGGWWEKEE